MSPRLFLFCDQSITLSCIHPALLSLPFIISQFFTREASPPSGPNSPPCISPPAFSGRCYPWPIGTLSSFFFSEPRFDEECPAASISFPGVLIFPPFSRIKCTQDEPFALLFSSPPFPSTLLVLGQSAEPPLSPPSESGPPPLGSSSQAPVRLASSLFQYPYSCTQCRKTALGRHTKLPFLCFTSPSPPGRHASCEGCPPPSLSDNCSRHNDRLGALPFNFFFFFPPHSSGFERRFPFSISKHAPPLPPYFRVFSTPLPAENSQISETRGPACERSCLFLSSSSSTTTFGSAAFPSSEEGFFPPLLPEGQPDFSRHISFSSRTSVFFLGGLSASPMLHFFFSLLLRNSFPSRITAKSLRRGSLHLWICPSPS